MRPMGCSRGGRVWRPCCFRANTLSRRQAYRSIEVAQTFERPVPVAEPTMAVTFKLPLSLVDAVRARLAAETTTINDLASGALRAILGEAGGNG